MTIGPVKRQVGVLPFMRDPSGMRIVLVTNFRGKRWMVPKGELEEGLTSMETAVQEAYEEGGIIGIPHPIPAGHYVMRKRGLTLKVDLFALEVQHLLKRWPEMKHRRRRVVDPAKAQKIVGDASLGQVLAALPAIIEEFDAGSCLAVACEEVD